MRVLLVGGRGGWERLYKAAAQAAQHDLTYRERELGKPGQPDAVLVVMPMCGHNLRKAAQNLARNAKAKYVPIMGKSVDAVATALAGLVR